MSKDSFKNKLIHNKRAAEELYEYRLDQIREASSKKSVNLLSLNQDEIKPASSSLENTEPLIGNHNTVLIDHDKD